MKVRAEGSGRIVFERIEEREAAESEAEVSAY
jgi:hypothetical protein